jgi:DNA repair exonuclease SbcCD ATPase subunit
MIYFKKIELQNYGSYKNQIFNFTPGQTLISGENGTGKSTIFEAIAFTIYKYSSRGKNPSYNQKGNCCVKLYFNINNDNYIIERYLNHSIHKNDLKLFCNDNDISDDLIKNTEEKIINLGFPEQEFFIMTITVLQGIPINFLQLTSTKRKEILEMLFNFNIWDNFRKKIDKYIKKNNLIKIKLDDDLLILNNKNIEIDTKIQTIEIININRLKEIEEQIKLINNNIKNQINEIEELEKENINSEKIKQTINDINNKLFTLNSLLQQKTQIISSNICPTCKRPYDSIEINTVDIKQEIIVLKDKINNLNKILNNTENEYNELKKQENLLNNKIIQLENNQNNLNKLIHNKNNIITNENTDELKIELRQLKEKINNKTKEIDNIIKKITDSTFIDKMLLPSSEFRLFILKNHIIRVNDSINEIKKYIFPELNIKLEVNRSNGVDILLDKQGFIDFNYLQLSGGERKRLDIIVILALQKFLIENNKIATNLLVFDEIFDSLDSNGINAVLESINILYDNNTCIYIISHINNIKNSFDNIINIIKEDGVSKIGE